MDGGEELPAALVSATGNAVALLSVEVSVEGTLTGEGPAEVLKGTQVVVDVPNSPSFADDAVMKFFRTSTANLLKAEAEAGVNHQSPCRWSAPSASRRAGTSMRSRKSSAGASWRRTTRAPS